MKAANIDFETFSAAGYYFDPVTGKRKSIVRSGPQGLGAVGTAVYVADPSFDLLSLAYDLNDGKGCRLWVPELGGRPDELIDFIQKGGVNKAWNSFFEWWVWNAYCSPVLGWPYLPLSQTADTMAKARVFGLPGNLGNACRVLQTENQKIKDGTRLLNKFSVPRSPSKKDKRTRIKPVEDPVDGQRLYDYNIMDVATEKEIDARIPDLNPMELKLWKLDQEINIRGVHIDQVGLANCSEVLRQATSRYTQELQDLTGGEVETVNELDKMKFWLERQGVQTNSLDADHVEALLNQLQPGAARRVVELRSLLGSASVKKLKTIRNQLGPSGRLHNLFMYYGAARTGRWSGGGPQPQNLPSGGPEVHKCVRCGKHHGHGPSRCPWCGGYESKPVEWGVEAVENALEVLSYKNLDYVERVFGDALTTISGCLRGLFTAASGMEFINSDYSSIEAVVLAALAGEEWRLDVFRSHGKIYEMSAAKILSIPFEEFIEYKKRTGQHHPERKKIGKIAELASGYQGWIGAWKAFGADKHLTEQEIKKAILGWRDASPKIGDLWEGLEGAAVSAVMQPGEAFSYRSISYMVKNDILHCQLPSGRLLYYHQPRVNPTVTSWGKTRWNLSYMGWNSNPKMGAMGWVRLSTYGGKLTENCISGDAEVLTREGWKRLDSYRMGDLVFDGVEFVNGGKLLDRGCKHVIELSGVKLTSDHLILCDDNQWRPADEITSQRQRFNRKKVCIPNNLRAIRLSPWKIKMESPVRLWERDCSNGERHDQKTRAFTKIMWMQNRGNNGADKRNARHEQTPAIRGLGFYEGSLSHPYASSLSELWGPWYYGLRRMAEKIRKFFKRYVSDLRIRANFGPDRRKQRVLQRKLSLSGLSGPSEQQTRQRTDLDGLGSKDRIGSFKTFRRRSVNDPLSNIKRVAGAQIIDPPRFSEPIRVFDIQNCGPRSRFVIRAGPGSEPFIVHNCTQAVARDIFANGLLNVTALNYPIVLHTHDEGTAEVPAGTGSIGQFEAALADLPEWCRDWPIKAAGGWRGLRYRKD